MTDTKDKFGFGGEIINILSIDILDRLKKKIQEIEKIIEKRKREGKDVSEQEKILYKLKEELKISTINENQERKEVIDGEKKELTSLEKDIHKKSNEQESIKINSFKKKVLSEFTDAEIEIIRKREKLLEKIIKQETIEKDPTKKEKDNFDENLIFDIVQRIRKKILEMERSLDIINRLKYEINDIIEEIIHTQDINKIRELTELWREKNDILHSYTSFLEEVKNHKPGELDLTKVWKLEPDLAKEIINISDIDDIYLDGITELSEELVEYLKWTKASLISFNSISKQNLNSNIINILQEKNPELSLIFQNQIIPDTNEKPF